MFLDTGHGVLYVSDITGSIFTESLNQHLYPNHAPVTDFYRIASMRGTYLATRLNPDRTLHTVITHNRGASWHALGAPTNVPDACQTKPSSTTMTTMTTVTKSGLDDGKVSTVSIVNNSDVFASEFVINQSKTHDLDEIHSSSSSEIWHSESNINDTMTTDSSTMKVTIG